MNLECGRSDSLIALTAALRAFSLGYQADPTRKFSIVQDHTEQGIVHMQTAVIIDESQFLEFIHEKIDSRPCRSNHLSQRLLRYFGKDKLRFVLVAVSGKQ